MLWGMLKRNVDYYHFSVGRYHRKHFPRSWLTNATVAAAPYSSGYTYQNIILIVSAVTTVLCLIFTVSLVTVHLSNWVKPHEQKH